MKKCLNIKFIRFFIIGLINTLFGYLMFALFIFLNFHYSIAVLLATILGVLGVKMKLRDAIVRIESFIGNPSKGLPEEVFLFISTVTPLVNVDLLIKDEQNRTLMTWRDDEYSDAGWHIPGGILRFKETIASRVKAVARQELGADVRFKEHPLAINEVIHPSRRVRGHFISLLYECTLISPLDKNLGYEKGIPKPRKWPWHNKCIYRIWFEI